MSVAYAISTTLVEPAQTVLAARALNVSPMIFVRAISGVFQAAIGMCLAVLALRVALVDAGVAAELRLVVCILAGAVVYGALCLWRVPEVTARGPHAPGSPRPALRAARGGDRRELTLLKVVA